MKTLIRLGIVLALLFAAHSLYAQQVPIPARRFQYYAGKKSAAGGAIAADSAAADDSFSGTCDHSDADFIYQDHHRIRLR